VIAQEMLLSGGLTMETVPVLFETGLRHLASEDLRVDFSRVETVDSAAVSMLLGWARAARRGQRVLHVSNLPDDLLSLARLYGVADLLPQQQA
jgi:phospholipid transport system transporter-binding protein